mmetsp:Transcript_52131/g.153849  ORF Transcript_52131/g.153849 Transcript_52131/m.153849 type:complete len:232 (+) Transcript_52131:15-710(+)
MPYQVKQYTMPSGVSRPHARTSSLESDTSTSRLLEAEAQLTCSELYVVSCVREADPSCAHTVRRRDGGAGQHRQHRPARPRSRSHHPKLRMRKPPQQCNAPTETAPHTREGRGPSRVVSYHTGRYITALVPHAPHPHAARLITHAPYCTARTAHPAPHVSRCLSHGAAHQRQPDQNCAEHHNLPCNASAALRGWVARRRGVAWRGWNSVAARAEAARTARGDPNGHTARAL